MFWENKHKIIALVILLMIAIALVLFNYEVFYESMALVGDRCFGFCSGDIFVLLRRKDLTGSK